MKMKKMGILLAVIICILLTTIPIFADSNIDDVCDEAFEYGYTVGKSEGYLDKNRDYPVNFDKVDIEPAEKKYEQFKKDKKVMSRIIESYKSGYTKGYIEGYYSDVLPDQKEGKKEEADYGEAFGLLVGEVYGRRDFYQGNKNNWSKAKPKDKTITSMFNLSKETSSYRTTFLNGFKESFKKSYEESYRKSNFEPKKVSYEDGLKDGETLGKLFGGNYGRKDYFEGKTSNWERNFPTGIKLRNEFALNREYKKYEDGFLTGFKEAYEESYNKGFREGNVEFNLVKSENAFNDGKDVGLNNGNSAAEMDCFTGKKSDISRHYLSDSQIISEYNLNLDNKRYRDGFISGFRDGFAEGYIKRFQELNKEVGLKKTETVIIPSSGGEFETKDKKLKLSIPSGTYYSDTLVTIINSDNNIKDKSSIKNKSITKLSEIYNISLVNNIKDYNGKNKIELSFEYYGPKTGGIYKLVNDEWLYISSQIEEEIIKAYIPPRSITESDSTYCILNDKNATICYDIRGHWAKNEINTYLRRNYIFCYKDKTFRPDNYMSKGQFLMVLNKVYDWDLPEDISSVKSYSDYKEFNNYAKVVQYSLNKGYIKGDNKNKLNLNSTITYKEVEILIRKVTGSDKFKWSNISNKMLYQEGIRSKSYSGYNQRITRGEVVYMLYLLNEWKN